MGKQSKKPWWASQIVGFLVLYPGYKMLDSLWLHKFVLESTARDLALNPWHGPINSLYEQGQAATLAGMFAGGYFLTGSVLWWYFTSMILENRRPPAKGKADAEVETGTPGTGQ